MAIVRPLGVGHVLGLSYHLVSLQLIAVAGNYYTNTSEGITVKVSKSGDKLFSPSIRQLNGLYGYRTYKPNEQHAANTPGVIPRLQVANINDAHCSHGHFHEVLLHKTAKQIDVETN